MNWLEALVQTHGNGNAISTTNLLRQGLPNRRNEEWRFTDIGPLTSLDPSKLKSSGPLNQLSRPKFNARTLRLILGEQGDSFVVAPGSAELPAGLVLNGIPPVEIVENKAWVFQLQDCLRGPSLSLDLAESESLQLELILDPAESAALVSTSLQITLAKAASLQLFIYIHSSLESLNLLTMQVKLGADAQFFEAQNLLGAHRSVLLTGSEVHQAPTSCYKRSAVVQGWAMARQEPKVVQVEGAAKTFLNDLAIIEHQNLSDLHSVVRFEGPNGCLEQLQKALVDGAGRSVFNGAVQVPMVAQGTNAAQLSRHLLLSDRARVDTKPELAIIADDVRCSHGATISSLAADELFYLQSRGILREQAVALLKRGFCQEIIDSMPSLANQWCSIDALLKDQNS
jgi:hypothetical protein